MTTRENRFLIEDIKDILLTDYPQSLREQLLDDILEDYIEILSKGDVEDSIKLQEIEGTVLKINDIGV